MFPGVDLHVGKAMCLRASADLRSPSLYPLQCIQQVASHHLGVTKRMLGNQAILTAAQVAMMPRQLIQCCVW